MVIGAAQEGIMAKNRGENYRQGSVDDRTQTKAPGADFVKRDTDIGRFMDQKEGGEPFKGVAKEKDGRRS